MSCFSRPLHHDSYWPRSNSAHPEKAKFGWEEFGVGGGGGVWCRRWGGAHRLLRRYCPPALIAFYPLLHPAFYLLCFASSSLISISVPPSTSNILSPLNFKYWRLDCTPLSSDKSWQEHQCSVQPSWKASFSWLWFTASNDDGRDLARLLLCLQRLTKSYALVISGYQDPHISLIMTEPIL